MKPWSFCCMLALLLAAPLRADPPPAPPRPTMVLQVGHSRGIIALAYSPDGKTLATGGDDARLWDVASGQVKAVLQVDGGVAELAFSPDGSALATLQWERHDVFFTPTGPVQLWDVGSGLPRMGLEGASGPFALSPDGKTLASRGQDDNGDDTLQLWDVASGQARATLEGKYGPLSFSPDGRTLAGGVYDDNGAAAAVQLWDVASGQFKATATLNGAAAAGANPFIAAKTLAFSPDGKTLATGSVDDPSQAQLWDVGSGKLKSILRGHTDALLTLTFSPDGKTLATGSNDNTARLWDVGSGQLKATLQAHTDAVTTLAFSPDSGTLATAASYDDNTAHLWDVASGKHKTALAGHTDWVSALVFAPDGQSLASGSGDSSVRLWDAASGKPTAILRGHADDSVNRSALSPDGKTLATGTWHYGDNSVRLWEVVSGQLRATLKDEELLAFSPDGKTLATESGDGVRLWDVASGQLQADLKGAYSPLAFSPDGSTLATGSAADNTARLWDTASGQLKATLQGHTHRVTDVTFSPDGKSLATGADYPDATVRLWDVASGHLTAALQGDVHVLVAPAFSPDSATLATGSFYGTARLWDVASGQLKATLSGATRTLDYLVFAPDGRTLATAGDEFTVWLWDAASGRLKATLPRDVNTLPALSPDSKTVATIVYDGNGGQSVQLWDIADGKLRATLTGYTERVRDLAFSPDGQTLAAHDRSGKLLLWDAASGKSIPITAETSLAQFPPEIAHPISANEPDPAAVALLDPFDGHVRATLQPLPDALPYLAAPPPDTPDVAAIPTTGGEWIATTPDGYFEGSANLAEFIRWSVGGVLYPAAAYWEVYYRPDLVRQALKIPGE